MAGITGQGTTYNLPNYTGELMQISPSETPFLSAIGGLNGGMSAATYEFEWQFYDLRDTSVNNTVVEGADAPTAGERVRANAFNVVEIHQSAIEVSYTKQAATQLKSGVNNNLSNPVTDELSFQIQAELKAMAVDVEKSFLSGVYNKPANNSTARKTRGILTAISTNEVNGGTVLATGAALAATGDTVTITGHGLSDGDSVILANNTATGVSNGVQYYVVGSTSTTFKLAATKGGSAIDITADGTADVTQMNDLAKDAVDNLVQSVFDTGSADLGSMVFLTGSRQKLALTKAYASQTLNAPPRDRTVGGVAIDTVVTDFGTFGVMVDRWMPANTLALVDLSVCRPRFLEIPGKGHMFVEPLAKTGAADKFQLYGEVGLEYGNERNHAKLTNLA